MEKKELEKPIEIDDREKHEDKDQKNEDKDQKQDSNAPPDTWNSKNIEIEDNDMSEDEINNNEFKTPLTFKIKKYNQEDDLVKRLSVPDDTWIDSDDAGENPVNVESIG